MFKSNVKKVLGIFLLVGGLVVPYQYVSARIIPKLPDIEVGFTPIKAEGITERDALENFMAHAKAFCSNRPFETRYVKAVPAYGDFEQDYYEATGEIRCK